MTNSKTLFNEVVQRIRLEESKEEIESMVYLLFEKKMGLRKMDVMVGKNIVPAGVSWEAIVERINHHEPIQYILGEADFYGRPFAVNPHVLIPRPETELLVQEVLNRVSAHPEILDIGTGSGCIAITLALEIPGSSVFALDISASALSTARDNAHRLEAHVTFLQHDLLKGIPPVTKMDAIVSNPPYVLESERVSMKKNVKDFEPALALFVPDDDPLLFYRLIARAGKALLSPAGICFAEINPSWGSAVVDLFTQEDFRKVQLKQDLDGKDRMVIATL